MSTPSVSARPSAVGLGMPQVPRVRRSREEVEAAAPVSGEKRVLLAAPSDVASRDLTLPTAAIPDLDPIAAVQAFYMMAAKLSAARGMNPDQPRHLSKVTKTN